VVSSKLKKAAWSGHCNETKLVEIWLNT
jgi:hypothetical protein